ncbi:MAG: phosphoribosylaminoimidazolesuccinocarboxamide synthase [Magnetovibrio sp.]|nr:phosphoribosylaminoimidazolesuccinocarboxamide synthase [Magnetovibrio sp.]|tara:strand:+ start:5185 stop:6159 length:975 start_codon:yes stop_codon:yes gene_type:complete
MLDKQLLQSQIKNVLIDATIPGLPNHYKGKVRDTYELNDGRIIIVATDRQSAFDKNMGAVPFKGQVLTQTARFWFEATSNICPNHVIEYPDPNVVVCKKLDMLPIEIIVRDYLTGSTNTSIWPMYRAGERNMYGISLPDGLVKNQKLPRTILTPTTKANQGEHDKPISPTEVVKQGILTQKRWEELAQLSLDVFSRGRELAAKRGLILVDTKFEFGLDEDGEICLADEILTPDSSRFWLQDTYAKRMAAKKSPVSLDKDFLRLWINERCNPYTDNIPQIPEDTLIEFSRRYVQLFEKITGQEFVADNCETTVLERIKKNLGNYF